MNSVIKNRKSKIKMNIYKFFKHLIIVVLFGFMTTGLNAQHFTEFEFVETAPENIRRAMANNARAVFRQIHEAHFGSRTGVTNLSTNNATQEAISRIQALWSTSKFYCIETEFITRVLAKSSGGYQIRNLPVFFVDGATPEEQFQEIVLDFNSQGRISDIYIAISLQQYGNILEAGNDVTDLRRRQLILGFVENFRTAYNRKDINYLDQVFSNDALIITGTVLRRTGDSPNPIGVDVRYVTQSKAEYISRLRGVFARNQFINVIFDEIEVMQDEERAHIYGVTLRQQWKAGTYSDEGWLFLLIDFRDEDNPMIWVRTWQPLDVPRNRVFGIVDFPPR